MNQEQPQHLQSQGEIERLQAEVHGHHRDLVTLQAAGAAITSSLDLQLVLDTIVREMTGLLRMRACLLHLWHPESKLADLRASFGPPAWLDSHTSLLEALTGRLAVSESLVRDRQAQQFGPDQLAPFLWSESVTPQHGPLLVLGLPIIFQDRVLGLVLCVDDQPDDRTLTDEEIELAQLLANQAAGAIENARLYEASQRRIAEVTTLNVLSQVITSILDLDEMLSIIADNVLWLLDVAATSVILHDREAHDLWFGASAGEGADFVRDRRLPLGKGIVAWVIEHGKPLLVPDVSKDPRFFSAWDQEQGFETHSILCVPLRARGKTIGAIEAINKTNGRFDGEDETALTAVAGWAAIAVENARLYERAQQEIGERKRAEAELRRLNQTLEGAVVLRTDQLMAERDRTQAILEAVGEAVIVTDLQGRIQYLNPAAIELTGYSTQDAASQSAGRLPAGVKPPVPAQSLSVSAGALEPKSVEVVSRRKDGSLYDAIMTVAPLLSPGSEDQAVGYVSVQRDITPIKEAERLKDQFVSNVSHELRTPLSVIALISGNLDMAYERLSDKRRRKLLRDLRQQVQVLDNLVVDILAISHIESGRISRERGTVDLAQLVREEVEKQLPLAQKRRQTLRVADVVPLRLTANEDQLRQVIRNLVNNAIKYTPDGGEITCDCAVLQARTNRARWPGSGQLPPGMWAALRIADTGIGISPEDLDQVFDRFFRVKNQGNIPGTGLGLSIVKELVDAHSGHLVATSTPGEGSVFAVYLAMGEG